ncbi:insulinase family protein [Flavobacterium alkalisoli]|uniref:Insulinase family protein n=1 Tax=Flavobacterium alkalisoli TaxID=2602769 RepID=A0A5B9FSI1_9FLAO|nr:M16 family metallopeptidase [Flavobacterium alkalisoli]QEE49875.1 insulinase family protein [Flavobacterium alkalisoli]
MNKLIKTFASVGFFVLVSFLATETATGQNLTENLATDPKVTIGTLKNGMKYYIRPNSKPENKVELRLIVNVGSLLEDDDQQGLAHFTEHMLFNGTKNFPKNELVNNLQSMGVQFGADLNAETRFDETVYMLPIPTDNPKNLETGFQILQDWAHGALMTDKDIDEERKIVLEEARSSKGARDRLQRKVLPELLANSRYSQRLPIGKEDLLRTFKPEVLKRFYKEWYRPDLMAVVVVGDVTAEKAETLVKKYFSTLTNPTKGRARTVYGASPYTKQSAMFLTDPEQSSTMLSINFSPRKTEADKTTGDYRNTLVEQLAFSAINLRYQDMASSATPPFAAAQTANSSFIRGYQALTITVIPTSDLTTALNAGVGELISIQEYGFTTAELELVKKRMLSYIEKQYNERSTTNSSAYLKEYERNFLAGEAAPGIEKEVELYRTLLPGITAEEVTAAFNKLFSKEDQEKFFAFVMSPETKDAAINSDATLLAAIEKSFAQKVTKKTDVTVSDTLLDQMPAKGSITKVQKEAKLQITTYTLSNGIKVTVKSTAFKSDEILFRGVKRGGTNSYGVKDKATVSMLGNLIQTMGYGKFTPTVLTKTLAGKNIGLRTSMTPTTNIVEGQSDIKGLESLLQLNYLELTQPRLDQELFNGFVSTAQMQLKFIKSNPQAAFVDGLITEMFNNNPLKPIAVPSEEDIALLNAQRAVAIYKKEFSSADGYHFFLVGNVDESVLKPLLEQYVASLPATGKEPEFVDNGLRIKPGNNKFVFKKGTEPQSLIIAQYFGEMPYSEDMALKANLIGDILTIRVIEKLREEMGSIYSGNFSGSMEKEPFPSYTIITQLPTGPENVDAILKQTDVEIAKLKKDGPEQKDLDKVRIATIEKRREEIKTNAYWLSKLQQLEFSGYSIERFLNFENEINKITVKDIKKAANKFFDGKNSFIAILNPEK